MKPITAILAVLLLMSTANAWTYSVVTRVTDTSGNRVASGTATVNVTTTANATHCTGTQVNSTSGSIVNSYFNLTVGGITNYDTTYYYCLKVGTGAWSPPVPFSALGVNIPASYITGTAWTSTGGIPRNNLTLNAGDIAATVIAGTAWTSTGGIPRSNLTLNAGDIATTVIAGTALTQLGFDASNITAGTVLNARLPNSVTFSTNVETPIVNSTADLKLVPASGKQINASGVLAMASNTIREVGSIMGTGAITLTSRDTSAHNLVLGNFAPFTTQSLLASTGSLIIGGSTNNASFTFGLNPNNLSTVTLLLYGSDRNLGATNNFLSLIDDGATGATISTGAGDIVLDPAGNNVNPGSDNADSLGQGGLRWANLSAVVHTIGHIVEEYTVNPAYTYEKGTVVAVDLTSDKYELKPSKVSTDLVVGVFISPPYNSTRYICNGTKNETYVEENCTIINNQTHCVNVTLQRTVENCYDVPTEFGASVAIYGKYDTVKVIGTISKGDVLVASDTEGVATSMYDKILPTDAKELKDAKDQRKSTDKELYNLYGQQLPHIGRALESYNSTHVGTIKAILGM